MIQKIIELKPLSVNKAWQGRRFKTKDYKQYEKDFNLLVGSLEKEKIKGDIAVTIEWHLKNDKRTDIDNPTKPLLDLLSKAGAWEDDRKIRELHLYKYESKEDKINVVITKV